MKIVVSLILIFVISVGIAIIRSDEDKAGDEGMMYSFFFLILTLIIYFLVGVCVQVLNWTNVLSTDFGWTEHLLILGGVTLISMTAVWFWMKK